MQDYHEFIDEVLVDEKAIEERVSELGAQINRDYAGEELLIVCLLRGAITFTADLMRSLTMQTTLDCMYLASYGNVLLVEDIVDTGRTLAHVLEMLKTRNPKSLKVCVLLDKKDRREVPVAVDYVGFDIPDKYIFGYGIDIDEHFRYLRFIASADLTKYKKPGYSG